MKNLLFIFSLLFSLTSYSQAPTIQDSTQVDEDVLFALVERVPIYKGCDKSLDNYELKTCFSKKIQEHVAKKFNSSVTKNIDAPPGTEVKINVFFKIDTTGDIVDIKARAGYPELEAEAIRVVQLIPKLEPGYIDGKAVRVPYFLPIKLKIANGNRTSANMQYPTFRGCDDSVNFEDLKNCTIKKIMDYIKVSINYELADKLFPLDKSTQFEVSFVINEKGKAEDISAKAHKREMAAEAIRILKRMPKMKKPGSINGQPTKVPVKFLMTIYF